MSSNSESRELRFVIGQALPAADPVARWLTVLAMASNDFFRMFRWLDGADDEGTRLLAFRLLASTFSEASTHLNDTLRLFPQVADFVASLGDDARREAEIVRGALDPKAPSYLGDWIERHRNVTFHYPTMHPDRATAGKEEITQALEAAAALESTITANDTFGSVRFNFADDVAVQWLPEASPDDPSALEALRDAHLALVRLTQRAAHAYLTSLPPGTVELR